MDVRSPPVPVSVLAYGLLGLVPFVAPPVVGLLWPELAPVAAWVQAVYGAVILSFLGGARWGLAVREPAPNVVVVSLAMLPSLAALALLLLPASMREVQLGGLAVLLVLHWIWDVRAPGLPDWYAGLRNLLTLGAVAAIVAQVVVLGRLGG